MKNKIPTAEEQLKELIKELDLPLNEYHIEVISARMRGFTKFHVEAALKQASEKAKINTEYYHEDDVGRTKVKEILDISPLASERADEDGLLYAVDTYEINKDSILNAYDLNNIK